MARFRVEMYDKVENLCWIEVGKSNDKRKAIEKMDRLFYNESQETLPYRVKDLITNQIIIKRSINQIN